jgi:hypothetical protein
VLVVMSGRSARGAGGRTFGVACVLRKGRRGLAALAGVLSLGGGMGLRMVILGSSAGTSDRGTSDRQLGLST